ncbi:OPT superfamily oligopeptide transporter [Polychaeton citri CBS 116435]|uniref:OPT superfamily oligopeptide transporter n=1 Tax=Polychaeton citri CBS 116435 TaxID=1314669 RepID=A0A9P4QGH5_9PEZI|nr:OPT superfamily oligopeptide transporter [Polychaeton citri CBS 116435]
MAPSRGVTDDEQTQDARPSPPTLSDEPSRALLEERAKQPQFTVRALICGLLIGVLIAFSNTYFGLQTGWISGMAMPSALIGYATFRGLDTLRLHSLGGIGQDTLLGYAMGQGFSEVENVLVQTVAGSVGTMPLGCGFVGVVPALEFLLGESETPWTNATESVDKDNSFITPEPHFNPDLATSVHMQPPSASSSDQPFTLHNNELAALRMSESAIAASEQSVGGIHLSTSYLILWALGLCFFGVVFAVPLRREVIIREKLKFPSGTATALIIGVLHGSNNDKEGSAVSSAARTRSGEPDDEEREGLLYEDGSDPDTSPSNPSAQEAGISGKDYNKQRDWLQQIRLLSISFALSGAYTLASYFVPQLHDIPIFGTYLGKSWLWALNPSPAYAGQGIIMGPATTLHMLLGAVLGWAVLSPIAKAQGWAPGEVDDWEKGSKGWIVWVSLAIMLADAIVSLGWLVLRPCIWYAQLYLPPFVQGCRDKGLKRHISNLTHRKTQRYSPVSLVNSDAASNEGEPNGKTSHFAFSTEDEYDAPPHHLISKKVTLVALALSLVFCAFAVQYSFSSLLPLGLTILSLVLALLLSIMGVRALGETDLNPVSGISKLTQLLFALVTPKGSRAAVPMNLIAGAISESGALQAGDLLQDLKTGHLLGASPKAQFWGQMIGSGVGAIVSALIYKLYTRVYDVPGGLFQVPTGYVWIFTARLVTGAGLPPRVPSFAFAAAALWAVLTALRIYGSHLQRVNSGHKSFWASGAWMPYVPGGIAVAVGMYNTPSFTLARTAGGLLALWWMGWKKRSQTPLIVLASGLILGEGLLSIVNLGLASAHVPHL